MRVVRTETRVAKVARASKKICGPTRRDDCKKHGEAEIGDHLWTMDGGGEVHKYIE